MNATESTTPARDADAPGTRPPAPLGAILLTFNSAAVIERTVRAALRTTPHVIAVDSDSADGTPAILERLGCTVVSRPFRHYADQRNWAIDTFGERFVWQLHLDADEVLDDHAIAAVREVVAANERGTAYILHRYTHFMGRALRFGGASNFHLRLFRTGDARCEDRLYDQHFVATVTTARLRGRLDDLNVGNLTEWVARHNRWSSLEAEEVAGVPAENASVVTGRVSADPRERRRLYKGAYYRLPKIVRALAYFGFRYFVQLGFLDGRAGFYYAAFQAFWFRLLVDAKLEEIAARSAGAARSPPPGSTPSPVR
jgi:glycosyltransferase involved in cell wall biosynthesis